MHPGGRTAFVVDHQEATYTLRRYHSEGPREGRPLLLVPALMANAEVFDICPEGSAVRTLQAAGVDVWLVDFADPEQVMGGMRRQLDDYCRAIDACIDRVADATTQDVHLAAYSQGGMLVYQVAAYRAGRRIASLVTFGSMVDMHKNFLPQDWPEQRALRAHAWIDPWLRAKRGSFGGLSARGIAGIFRAISWRKRLRTTLDTWRHVNDRAHLVRTEPLRRYLGGEGFIAWAGPALEDFTEDFVVHNRLVRGGFFVCGERHALTELRVPILTFLGTYDDLTSYACVRAIQTAAPHAPIYEREIPSGHFGLVVGGKALEMSWPSTIAWLRYQDGRGPEPAELTRRG